MCQSNHAMKLKVRMMMLGNNIQHPPHHQHHQQQQQHTNGEDEEPATYSIADNHHLRHDIIDTTTRSMVIITNTNTSTNTSNNTNSTSYFIAEIDDGIETYKQEEEEYEHSNSNTLVDSWYNTIDNHQNKDKMNLMLYKMYCQQWRRSVYWDMLGILVLVWIMMIGHFYIHELKN